MVQKTYSKVSASDRMLKNVWHMVSGPDKSTDFWLQKEKNNSWKLCVRLNISANCFWFSLDPIMI